MNNLKSPSQSQVNHRMADAVGTKPKASEWTKHEFEDRLLDKVDDGIQVITQLVYMVGMEKRHYGEASIKTRTKLIRNLEKLTKLLTGIPNKLDHSSK